MKNRYKIILIMCVFVLMIGSVINVYASTKYTYKLDKVGFDNITISQTQFKDMVKLAGLPYYEYYYNMVFTNNGSSIGVIVTDGTFMYKEDSFKRLGIVDGTVMYVIRYNCLDYTYEMTYSTIKSAFSSFANYGMDEKMIEFKSTSHVYNEDGSVFFWGPVTIPQMAVPLVETIPRQMMQITIVAVGCLASLIGLVALVKVLRRFLN